MIRPATDREVLVLRLVARQGGDGAVKVPAAALRAVLARLDHAETGLDPLPIRVDFGRRGLPLPRNDRTLTPVLTSLADHMPTLAEFQERWMTT